jgi:hypothetical protein
MRAMKPQFSVKTILLLTAAVAITCAGVIGYRQISGGAFTRAFMIRYQLAFAGPLYVPAIFAAFALGCKKLSVPIVIAFAFTEAVAVGVLYFLFEALSHA